MKAIDCDIVQAFVLVADLRSFTRAAEVLNTTQGVVSLRLKRLEKRLCKKLIERTPRIVRLTGDGELFLEGARDLLRAHERALAMLESRKPHRLNIGIGEQVAGPELPLLLARLNSYEPSLLINARIAQARDVLESFDSGKLDAAIVRRESERRDGEVLFEEPLHWYASPNWQQRLGEPLRLITLADSCSVRTLAIAALDRAGISWTEVLTGGGVLAVAAAVAAGLGVASMSRRVAPVGAVDVGASLGLPSLSPSQVVLYSLVSDNNASGAIRALASSFRTWSADKST